MSLSLGLLLLLVAVLANAFAGFAGGGVGLIQFPVLLFFGLPFGVALATHKVATVALGLGAGLRHLRAERAWDRSVSLLMLMVGVPGVILGALFILHVPEVLATRALGVLTVLMGLYSVARHELGLEHRPAHRDRAGLLMGGLGLFVIAVLNGSLASGTGLLCTLFLVRWFGLDYRRAVGHTLLWVGLVWNGAGALTLGVLGQARWSWLPPLLAGAVIGGYAGSHWGIGRGNRWIKRAFEALTLVVGIRLLL